MLNDGRYTRLKESLVPAALLLFTLFVFGPFTIYYGNPGELNVGYLSVLRVYLSPAACVALLLILVALLLPGRLFRFYNPLLLGIGIALWLQGSVIVGSYGFLDGTELDFSAQSWRVWHETALWVLLPVLTILFYRRQKQNFIFLGKLVLAIEVVLFMAGLVTNPASFRGAQPAAPPEDIYLLSSRENVLHILLDGFQSDCFSQVLEDFPEHADAFEGFVFYQNNIGVFPTTRMSIPAILTGRIYRNQRPMEDFIADVMSSETLPQALYRNGYQVDMLTLRKYRYGREYTSWYTVPMPFGDPREVTRFAAAQVFDLSLFRHVPHLLKPGVFRDQQWLSVSLVPFSYPEDRRLEPSNAVAFFRDYMEKLRVGDSTPRYKFIHLFIPHLPVVLDCACNSLGPVKQSRGAFVEQSACTVRVLAEFLGVLREHEVYADSLIIVSADHGNKFPSKTLSTGFEEPLLAARAAALLMIKPPHSSGKLKVSNAPVRLSDIPATVADLSGISESFPGRSVVRVEEDESRERSFFYYVWRHRYWNYDYLPGMEEYVVNGDLFDPDSWTFRTLLEPPGTTTASEVRLDLGIAESRRNLGTGWGKDRIEEDRSFVWAVGEQASLILPRFKDSNTLLTARVKPPPLQSEQVITVVVDGEELGRWEINPGTGWREYSVIVPLPAATPSSVLEVQFHFAQVSGEWYIAAAFDFVSVKPQGQ